MVFSCSYFIYDTVWMIIEGLMDTSMAIHHPLVLFGYLIPLYENTAGQFSLLALFFSEISNPPMHARNILRIAGRKLTKSYECCELVFITLYIYARLLAIWPTVFSNFACETNHVFFKISCAGLMCQSVYMIFQMYHTLMRRINQISIRKRN